MYKFTSSNKKQVKKILRNHALFPKRPPERVKFAMALALFFLDDIDPSEKIFFIIECAANTAELTKYLWTALMVFGKNHPYLLFNHENIYGFEGYRELGGYWSTFSKSSLYETLFKHHLTKEMLILTDNPELFEGISNKVYKTINDQIKAKELEMQGIKPTTEEDLRKQEEIEQQEKKREQRHDNKQKTTTTQSFSNPLVDLLTSPTITANELLNNGLNYYEGRNGTKRDYIKAKDCFEKASEKKEPTAFYYLGKMYQYAQGVERDSLRAARYYQLAIYLGCAKAQNQLTSLFNSRNLAVSELTAIAQMYDHGDHEIIKDRLLAIKLYEQAAHCQDPSAAFCLAQLHLITEGDRKKDINRAFSYYLLAARLGQCEALTALERLAEEMGARDQLAFSELYGTFFHDNQKAAYWRAKSMEATPPHFDIQFN